MTESQSRYIQFQNTHARFDECPLTLFSTEDSINSIVIRTSMNNYVTYNLDELAKWLSKSTKDPLTNLSFNKVVLDRVDNYLKYKNIHNEEKFGKLAPDINSIEKIFINFLNNDGDVTENELIFLRRWFTFDISDKVFSNLGTKNKNITENERLKFRNIAQESLIKLNKDSYVIRPSSINDSIEDNIYTRVITSLSLNKDNYIICNKIYFHYYGYGYTTLEINRGSDIKKINFETLKKNNTWFPSFIDVLLNEKKENNLKLSTYYIMPKNNYLEFNK